jgi:hypothetical protein
MRAGVPFHLDFTVADRWSCEKMQLARRTRACATSFLLALSSQLLFAQDVDQAPTQDPLTDVASIISGYRANRERIPFGRVKIVKTEGYAQSVDDALARHWLDEDEARQVQPGWPPSRSERLWIFDGETSRFEDVVLPLPLQSQFGVPVIVQNEQVEIRRSPKLKDTRVRRVEKLFFQEPWSPFLKGNQMAAAKQDVVAFDRESELDGRMAVALTIRFLPGSQSLARYWVDPTRGYLPVRIEESDGRIYVFEEFIQNSRGGWMPRRWLEVYPAQADRPRRVADYEVTEWDFETRPGDDLFRVSVEAGETFSFDAQRYRVGGTEIDLRWFTEDGPTAALSGAFEVVRTEATPAGSSQDQFQLRFPLRPLELVSILVISIATGFIALFLWDWLRRRRKARARLSQPND